MSVFYVTLTQWPWYSKLDLDMVMMYLYTKNEVPDFRQTGQTDTCSSADHILEYSYGHIIPKENLLAVALAYRSSGHELDFTYQSHEKTNMVSCFCILQCIQIKMRNNKYYVCVTNIIPSLQLLKRGTGCSQLFYLREWQLLIVLLWFMHWTCKLKEISQWNPVQGAVKGEWQADATSVWIHLLGTPGIHMQNTNKQLVYSLYWISSPDCQGEHTSDMECRECTL